MATVCLFVYYYSDTRRRVPVWIRLQWRTTLCFHPFETFSVCWTRRRKLKHRHVRTQTAEEEEDCVRHFLLTFLSLLSSWELAVWFYRRTAYSWLIYRSDLSATLHAGIPLRWMIKSPSVSSFVWRNLASSRNFLFRGRPRPEVLFMRSYLSVMSAGESSHMTRKTGCVIFIFTAQLK